MNYRKTILPPPIDCNCRKLDCQKCQDYLKQLAENSKLTFPQLIANSNSNSGLRRKAISLPCFFRGDEVPASEAPDQNRQWYQCDNNPSYGIVCSCKGCNSKCPGYVPDIPEDQILAVDDPPEKQFDFWAVVDNKNASDAAKDIVMMTKYRVARDRFIKRIPAYPEGKFKGRGIVLMGGGKFQPSLWITIHMIRKFSDLPIELWYRSHEETLDERFFNLPNLKVIDASTKLFEANRRQMGGWESKNFCLLNSSFEEVLFTDADCYPVAPFEDLFDKIPSGFMVWKNIGLKGWRWFPEAHKIENHGRIPALTGGNWVFRKKEAWRVLQLASYLDDRSEYWYMHGCGDQDSIRASMLVLDFYPDIVTRKCEQSNKSLLVFAPAGGLQWIHRYQNKFGLLGDFDRISPPVFEPTYPYEREVWNLFFDWYKV